MTTRKFEINQFRPSIQTYILVEKRIKPVGRIEHVPKQFVNQVSQMLRRDLGKSIIIKLNYSDNSNKRTDIYYGYDARLIDELINVTEAILMSSNGQPLMLRAGELLGYPLCCSDAFSRMNKFLQTNNEWAHLKNRCYIPGEVDPFMNPFAGFTLGYIPCSLNCKETAKQLKLVKDEIPGVDKDLYVAKPYATAYLLDRPGNFVFIDIVEEYDDNTVLYKTVKSFGKDYRLDYIKRGNRMSLYPGRTNIYHNSELLHVFTLDMSLWWHKRAFNVEYWRLLAEHGHIDSLSSGFGNENLNALDNSTIRYYNPMQYWYDVELIEKQYAKGAYIRSLPQNFIEDAKKYIEKKLDRNKILIKAEVENVSNKEYTLFFGKDPFVLKNIEKLLNFTAVPVDTPEHREALGQICKVSGNPDCCCCDLSGLPVKYLINTQLAVIYKRSLYEGDVNALLNPFSGLGVSHLPCKLTCKQTINQICDVARSLDKKVPKEMEKLRVMAKYPVLFFPDNAGLFAVLDVNPSQEQSKYRIMDMQDKKGIFNFLHKGNMLSIDQGHLKIYKDKVLVHSADRVAFWWYKKAIDSKYWLNEHKTEDIVFVNPLVLPDSPILLNLLKTIRVMSKLVSKKSGYKASLVTVDSANVTVSLINGSDSVVLIFQSPDSEDKFLYRGKHIIVSHHQQTPPKNRTQNNLIKLVFGITERLLDRI